MMFIELKWYTIMSNFVGGFESANHSLGIYCLAGLGETIL